MMSFLRKLARAIAGISLLAGPGGVYAREPQAEVAPAAEAREADGPALWKVSDEDTTIYLFGTIHALPKGVDWYKGPIKTAFESSDMLVTEVMVDKENPQKLQQLVMTLGLLPEGQNLRDLLNADQRKAYEAGMAKIGMPVAAFDRYKPWYAAMMFSMIPLLKQGYASDSGSEAVLTAAGGEEKQRGQLESFEQQLGMFDKLPQQNQVAYLLEVVNGVDDLKPTIDKMVQEWLHGDADGLAKLMNEGMSDPVVLDKLLYQRNRNWAEWIDKRLDQPGTVFVAVGAGHLAGKDSVQKDLEKMGLKVERVQ